MTPDCGVTSIEVGIRPTLMRSASVISAHCRGLLPINWGLGFVVTLLTKNSFPYRNGSNCCNHQDTKAQGERCRIILDAFVSWW